MKQTYSIFSLARNALSHHEDWQEAWRSPEPKPDYDVVIVGGGGHGLATAYYLAKEHGITNVAVLEKGWLGGGNTGRNTTDRALQLSVGRVRASLRALAEAVGGPVPGPELQRDVQPARPDLDLAHTPHDMQALAPPGLRHPAQRHRFRDPDPRRRSGHGARSSMLARRRAIRSSAPACSAAAASRATMRSPGAIARAADARGVDIIQNCEVTGFDIEGGRVAGVRDHARLHRAPRKSASSSPAIASVLAGMAGFRLPIESHPLQAMVSEPIKPVLDSVVMSGAGARLCQPVRQGRAGVRRRHRQPTTPIRSAAARRSSRTC